MQFSSLGLFMVVAILEVNSAFAIDAFDRLTEDKLKSAHQAIMELRSERREVPRSGPLKEYRANLHVHSAFSHDSRGQIEDIVQAAKAAGTSILMFNEHPAKHYDIYSEGHQGMRDGVLLIQGAETNGMLVFPRISIKQVEGAKPQELSDFVRGREGLTFLSHLEERMDWNIQGLTGVEIYNTHADAKDEKRLFSSMKNPIWLMKIANLVREYPQESFSALHDYPADYLKRWDELCQLTPLTGVSANDSHQNVGIVIKLAEEGKVQVEDPLGEKLLTLEAAAFALMKPIPKDAKVGDILFELRLDRYEYSLRHAGTHLLMTDLSQPSVWQALNGGRAFVAFDWIADSTGFDFAALIDSDGNHRSEMGSNPKFRKGMKLIGKAPLAGTWKIVRNGQECYQASADTFELPLAEPGVYRAELWLKVANEDRVWVLSNPIYVAEQ